MTLNSQILRRILPLCAMAVLCAAAAGAQRQPANGSPVVVLETTMGEITIELNQERAPVSTANFLQYVRDGHYEGTIFHRVIRGFMVQAGGFTPAFERKPTREPIRNEATNRLRNMRGTVAMARTDAVRSATAEFFINTVDNTKLDYRGMTPDQYGYAVFGKVISGMDVVDAIERVKTGRVGPMDDVPLQPIVITRASIKP
jgi:cyclophilin family peptidyl-prolyl cis-trans isomerase